MKMNKILTRENESAKELVGSVEKVYKGIYQLFNYSEVYYLDFEVDENTGIIDEQKMARHYTKN